LEAGIAFQREVLTLKANKFVAFEMLSIGYPLMETPEI
jgi:hypothetical protein